MKKIKQMTKKELLTELGRWMKKAEDQKRIIAKLTDERNKSKVGTEQLGRVVDAILIEVVKTFGTEVGKGVFEAEIPQPDVTGSSKFILLNSKDEKARTYKLRVEPVKEERDFQHAK